MKRWIDRAARPLLLVASTLLAEGCTPATMNLGIYDDDVERQSDDAGQDAAAETADDASEPAVNPDDAQAPAVSDDAAAPLSPDPSPDDACDEAPPADDAVEVPGCAACGCLSEAAIDLPDSDCFELRAHAPDDAAAAYPLPQATEQYVRFTLPAPSRGAHYIRSVQPIVDASHVLQRLTVLEHNSNEGSDNGLPKGVEVATSKLPWPRVVYRWSPGMSGMYLDPTVGIPSGPETSYTVEIHYSGAGRPLNAVSQEDSSGVRICATSTPPRFSVSLTRQGNDFTWRGGPAISGTDASGNCSSDSEFPIYLLALMPEMKVPGRSVKLVLDRASGKSQELLYDSLIDPETPQTRPLARLERRDMLTVTCKYDEPTPLGRGVGDTSCELLALQWPAYALRGGASLGEGSIGSCMQ